MNKNKKILLISHWDLDGLGCYQLIRWTFPESSIECVLSTPTKLRAQFSQLLVSSNIEDYDKIFIMDLDVRDSIDLIDMKNVIIIDHHSNGEYTKSLKNAKPIIKEYSSATKLGYELFKRIYNLNISKEKKILVALIDDYDSYTLKIPDSKKLNTVFWSMSNKKDEFTKSFGRGFYGFSKEHENMYKLYQIGAQKTIDEARVFCGEAKIQGKTRKVCSAFSEKYINEIADFLINDHKCDIAIVVNPVTQHISFRRRDYEYNEDLDLDKFAQTIADGGGHKYASGGCITENFVNFTKLLKPVST